MSSKNVLFRDPTLIDWDGFFATSVFYDLFTRSCIRSIFTYIAREDAWADFETWDGMYGSDFDTKVLGRFSAMAKVAVSIRSDCADEPSLFVHDSILGLYFRVARHLIRQGVPEQFVLRPPSVK